MLHETEQTHAENECNTRIIAHKLLHMHLQCGAHDQTNTTKQTINKIQHKIYV